MKKLLICALAATAAINVGLAGNATVNYNGSYAITNSTLNVKTLSFALQGDALGLNQLTCAGINIKNKSSLTINSRQTITCEEKTIPTGSAYYESTVTVTGDKYSGKIGIPGLTEKTSLSDAVSETSVWANQRTPIKAANVSGNVAVLLLSNSNQ